MRVEVFYAPYSTGGSAGEGYYTVFFGEPHEVDRFGVSREETVVRMTDRGLQRGGQFQWTAASRSSSVPGRRVRLAECPWPVQDAVEAVVAATYGDQTSIEDTLVPTEAP